MVFFGILKRKRIKNDVVQKFHLSNKWPNHVVILDENNFNDFISQYPLSIVDFWASWCGPCTIMAPRIRRLSRIYNRKVAFGKLDTQKHVAIAKQYKIMGIPHLIFFRYGKKIISITGVRSIGDLKDIIDNLLEK